MLKPPRLRPGDTLAAVSLSWGGPGACPARYEAGKRQCEEEFGVRIVATRHALRDPAWIAANPKARADDLMEAFADPSIHGVVSTIGGEDSIRILRHLDLGVLRAHPKVFIGYSDTTVTHFACFAAGLTSFYGPAIMSGFAENGGMHRYLVDSVRRTLFTAEPVGEVRPNDSGWTVEWTAWADPASALKRRALTPSAGWRWYVGGGNGAQSGGTVGRREQEPSPSRPASLGGTPESPHTIRGPLIGGCAEVLSWLPGTRVWPRPEAWDGAIFFLETSEEAPPQRDFRRWLRHFGEMGIFHRAGAVLLGRPGGALPVADHVKYDETLLGVVRDELGLASLPIVTGVDFGHTDPFFVLPYGVTAEVDCAARRFSIVEAAVT